MTDHYDYLFKVVLMGEAGVGKTSLFRRYTENMFQPNYNSTIGVDFSVKTLEIPINGIPKQVKIQIWDTAGQERFKAIGRSYIRGSHGLILVFALNDMNSFIKLKDWIDDTKDIQYILCIGSKADLVDDCAVSDEIIKTFCSANNMTYMETSAKTGQSVEALFVEMTTKLTELAVANHLEEYRKDSLLDITYENDLELGVKNNKCCGGTG